MRFLVGIIMGFILGFYSASRLFTVSDDMKRDVEVYTKGVEDAEHIINENVLACEDAIEDERRALNQMCDKYRIRNCKRTVTSTLPDVIFNEESGQWLMSVSGTNGYSPL